jgi:hypothetical protein
MKVPVQVMVGGKKLRIEYPELLPEGSSGELVCGEALVRISKARHVDERAIFHTLFHEMLHFALEVTGHSAEWSDEKEEPLVYALENMLADLFLFNPRAPVKYRDVAWPEAE